MSQQQQKHHQLRWRSTPIRIVTDLNCNRTGELGRSNFEGIQFLATPDEWGSAIVDASVVEDQDPEWRG